MAKKKVPPVKGFGKPFKFGAKPAKPQTRNALRKAGHSEGTINALSRGGLVIGEKKQPPVAFSKSRKVRRGLTGAAKKRK